MSADIRIAQIETPGDIDAARGLVREFFAFAATLNPDAKAAPAFAGLEEQLARLPGKFGPPGGAFLLARVDGAPAGCAGFFDHGDGRAEVKRMYVRAAFRGLGLGERLVEQLIRRAGEIGYKRLSLSTFHKLEAAQRLYARAGFERCGPSWSGMADPAAREVFMERAL